MDHLTAQSTHTETHYIAPMRFDSRAENWASYAEQAAQVHEGAGEGMCRVGVGGQCMSRTEYMLQKGTPGDENTSGN